MYKFNPDDHAASLEFTNVRFFSEWPVYLGGPQQFSCSTKLFSGMCHVTAQEQCLWEGDLVTHMLHLPSTLACP